MPRKHDTRMTETQYKTLRRLILLWFKVLARRKYSIFQNLLLGCSLAFSIYLYMIVKDKKFSIINKPINFEQSLELANYPSITSPNHNLLQRFNRLHKKYLSDKQRPDSYYYKKGGKIDPEWSRYCNLAVKKIINIKTRMTDIEILLENNYPGDSDKIQKIIRDLKYEEALSDMSNYYARFLSSESYNYLLQTSD